MDKIDVTFDFTTDTPGYWTDFWKRNDGLGAGGRDPDADSRKLQKYHQFLWSKELPNGEKMELSAGLGPTYLAWNGFRFGSDSIAASFRYTRYGEMLRRIADALPDYHAYMEDFIRKTYTIGGAIIFPKRQWSINQARGCNRYIRDRWDLTLECIRRYYAGEESPLTKDLQKDSAFFDLFVDFKGYVDFFYLQDCVSADYQKVDIWLGSGDFTAEPLPATVEEYFRWMNCNLEFVAKRNHRIQQAVMDAE